MTDWQALDQQFYKSWLAAVYKPDDWLDYFQELSESNTFCWFGLTASGQSWGSGDGEMPRWLEVMGQYLRPTDFLDVTDSAVRMEGDEDLFTNLESFYVALTTGDEKSLEKIYSNSYTSEVTQVLEGGGRLDPWNECLVEGARPSDMKISGADATVFSDTEAYTTVVEFPANTGLDSATLLAVQRWTRPNKSEPWKLELHQTIPWSLETRAQGTLRCDCRGCVALTRSQERRTFGGIIG
jgi:hypothetical protein